LRNAILRTSFDLHLEELPHLSIAGVERYLAHRGCPRQCGLEDRPLRGCLVAENGSGYLFVDRCDDEPERTFSLAHELAHFLRDYWQRRQKAVAALGATILEVLDGRREATPKERLHGLLRGVPIGCHVHLMRREGGVLCPGVETAERDADRLALELLAPAEEVLARLPAHPGVEQAQKLLCQVFGLPTAMAREYSEILLGKSLCVPLLDRLKKAIAARRTSEAAREVDSGGSRDEQRP
jgi:hypothetical protein